MPRDRILPLLLAWWYASAAVAEPVSPPAAAVVSAHPLATEAGVEVLLAGGNAFDAAVAVSAALAVVEPQSSGLGGGGFWLLHRAADGLQIMVDGRERAPLAAHRDLYLSPEVTPDEGTDATPAPSSMNGPLAAGIPGEPAALIHIAERYGRLPTERTLAPAVRLAREGFPVTPAYRRLAEFRLAVLRAHPSAAQVFLTDNEVPEVGRRIRQPALARTLEALAEHGRDGFYAGPVGATLVRTVRAAGGIWTAADLAQYRIEERLPIQADYRGTRLTAASPPSSGGIALATMLNILADFDLDGLDATTRIHLIVEAMRRAYRDRAVHLGDPDFVPVPVDLLTDPDYAAGLRATIRADRALPSTYLPGVETPPAGPHTTHFSVLDREGNRVAATLSVNYPFGSGFVAAGTGVLLNDEMDDFSIAPGVPNAYGLVGAQANAIAPGKRPLSSMTPSFLDDGERLAILGTPGGSRIISMVLLAGLGFAAGDDAAQWVARPRFHHQYLPDRIDYEPNALSAEALTGLRTLGHHPKPLDHPYGDMQAILWDRTEARIQAASDPRGEGRACILVDAEPTAADRARGTEVRCGTTVDYAPRTEQRP